MKTDAQLEAKSQLYKTDQIMNSEAWHALARAVGESVGEASTCWESLAEAGVFNEYLASAIVDKIINAAVTYANTRNIEDSIPDKARKHVFEYIQPRLDKTDNTYLTFTLDDVFTVWSVKVLQNWKCLVSTKLPDGMYYEVTFDGDMNIVYLDAYKKFENIGIAQGEDHIG